MLCRSKMSKMVFVAFMQHCIKRTVTHLTHVEGVEDVKYYILCIQGFLPLQGGSYLLFEKPYVLWV